MIIGSSTIGMESARKYYSVRVEGLHSREADNSLGNALNGSFGGNIRSFFDRYEKTGRDEGSERPADRKMSSGLSSRAKGTTSAGVGGISDTSDDAFSEIRMHCINYLIYLLFGYRADEEGYSLSEINGSEPTVNMPGFDTSFSASHYFYEEETTSFNAAGRVVTADGRELSFNLGFSMSRSFEETFSIDSSSLSSKLCDPLVINLDTDIASVSDQKIRFDLDGDGEKDNISRLGKKSGFLSLDLNDDGVINDGTELFGTASGDGFKDLSGFDSDDNGWIDEADEVFNRLRICTFDEKGEQRLFSLKEKGVGAIFLGNVNTGFSLNEHYTNKTNAVLRKTGIFLYENGAAGTVQHLDLAEHAV